MYLSVLQNQWVILAFYGGIFLMLAMVLAYLTMWRPRISSDEPISGVKAIFKWIPWFIFVLIIAIIIFQVTYTIVLHYYPPNI